MPLSRWLDLKVTQRCNNHARKCTYCAVPTSPPTAPELMAMETIHRTLLDARALGFDTFWLLGGEPTCRDDAEHLVDPLASDPRVALTVVTNGKTPRWPLYDALFATAARRAMVQVSLDSRVADNHKRANPDQSVALVRDLASAARQRSRSGHECAVEVHAVISRENHDTFDEMARFFAGFGVPVTLAMVCPWRLCDEPRAFDEFTAGEIRSVAQRIRQLHTTTAADKFNPIVADFLERMLSSSSDRERRRCGAGLTHVVVNADGGVYRCMADSFRPERAVGNVNRARLHEILAPVQQPCVCDERSDCFDGYAWDRVLVDHLAGAPWHSTTT